MSNTNTTATITISNRQLKFGFKSIYECDGICEAFTLFALNPLVGRWYSKHGTLCTIIINHLSILYFLRLFCCHCWNENYVSFVVNGAHFCLRYSASEREKKHNSLNYAACAVIQKMRRAIHGVHKHLCFCNIFIFIMLAMVYAINAICTFLNWILSKKSSFSSNRFNISTQYKYFIVIVWEPLVNAFFFHSLRSFPTMQSNYKHHCSF